MPLIDMDFRTPQQERVELRRSLSVPNAVRSKKLATQAYLRAAEKGDVKAMRMLAIEADAELTGVRSKTALLGCDPVHLIDSSHHLTGIQRNTIKHEFTELPQLINAVKSAKALPSKPKSFSKASASDEASKTISQGDESRNVSKFSQGMSKSMSKDEFSKQTMSRDDATTIKAGNTTRAWRSENTVLRLASTLGAPGHICEAVKTQPKLMWESALQGEQALPTLAQSLKSEEIAVRAVHHNPALLRVDPVKIKRILPALISICGSSSEAAYTIATRPDLLELERPAAVREALQAVSACMGNLKDALWLVGQTGVPPSVKVVARQWCREDVTGEYFLVDGGQVDDKPVWCKPAAAMSHLGAKARDVFIVYCKKGVVGGQVNEGCWTFTPNWKASKQKYEYCDPDVMAWAPSTKNSPDQVDEGCWHFASEAQKSQVPGLWPTDRYVDCVYGERERGPWLFAHTPIKLRKTFDMLRETIGMAWRQADASMTSGPRFITPIKGDLVHYGGQSTFLEMGSFSHVNGWNYVQLPAAWAADAPPLTLTAWESIQVHILYCKEPEADPEAAEATPEDEGEEEDVRSNTDILRECGFRPLLSSMATKGMPKLKGAPEIDEDIMVRTFPPGQVQFSVPLGPGKLPPLIFFRSQACAMTNTGTACQMTKPKAYDPMYFDDPPAPGDAGEDAVPPPPGEEPEEPQEPEPSLMMWSPGEIGYTGFFIFRGTEDSQFCEETVDQVRIDSMDKLKVAVAFFHFPPEAEEAEEEGEGEGEPLEESGEGSSAKNSRKVVYPPLPDWVARDGWKPFETKLPITVKTKAGKMVDSAYIMAKDCDVGSTLPVPGSGPEWTVFVLFRQSSDPRPNQLRRLLLREPGLLAAGENLTLLLRRARAELGDDLARQVFMEGATAIPAVGTGIVTKSIGSGADGSARATWPKLCQQGTADNILTWVFEHKVDALASQLRGNTSGARQILNALGGLKFAVPVPQLLESCRALREVLNPARAAAFSLLEVLQKQPVLLNHKPSVFRNSLEVIQKYLPGGMASASLRAKLPLLMQTEELAHLFGRIAEKYEEDFISSRVQERTKGEWPRWPELVGKPETEIQKWIGRVVAEERELSCKDRVRSFGAAAHGAAAWGKLTGEIPEIPPLIL
eukprot:TRINITY_DN28144_c0_g1_i1.p1 TRINITY_DN28144_c0_g1~~TRINITY_DN28144_c0_g1_i1.p1  ORF type:complete len:1141 (-),score=267.46 TRINITY_DN28144_c0_g1_i1:27-3449(-)